jgi:hypothetical protein
VCENGAEEEDLETATKGHEMKRLLLTSLLSMVASGMIGSLASAQQVPQQVPVPIRINTAPSKQQPANKDEGPDHEALKDKWIVRFITRDGKPNAAQIGQKIGDIITIKKDGDQVGFG